LSLRFRKQAKNSARNGYRNIDRLKF